RGRGVPEVSCSGQPALLRLEPGVDTRRIGMTEDDELIGKVLNGPGDESVAVDRIERDRIPGSDNQSTRDGRRRPRQFSQEAPGGERLPRENKQGAIPRLDRAELAEQIVHLHAFKSVRGIKRANA